MLTFKSGGRSIILANTFGNLGHDALINGDHANNLVVKYLDKLSQTGDKSKCKRKSK
jgi:hypothetical protein